MKMACGENPKRVYGRKGAAPATRMGEAAMLRQRLEGARARRAKQGRAAAEGEDESEARPETEARDSPPPVAAQPTSHRGIWGAVPLW